MFKELVPILRNRAVVLTVTALDDDLIRVNVVPKKIRDDDHDALTTPLSVTGTAEELDAQLGSTLVGFVASHLQMKNALEKAKCEMDAATKAAQAEARSRAKTPPAKATPRPELPKAEEGAKSLPRTASEPPRSTSLFDAVRSEPEPQPIPDEEEEVLARIEDREENADGEDLGEAA